uniref:Zinc finger protein 592 n=1 Tax=Crocodylus porosus TaxID=8502 RepID=A0A7M4EBH3_CROPO
MGDMKTPDFDDLLAAFDIPDPTSLDAKETIQSTGEDNENHLKPSGICIDENVSLSHSVPAPDAPVVSVIVKNTSRQESFEAEKEGNHLGPGLLHNGFRASDLPSEPHNLVSRNYPEKLDQSKSEPLPTFSQFSPISSPEPEDSFKENNISDKPKHAQTLYFSAPQMYIPTGASALDHFRTLPEPELSIFLGEGLTFGNLHNNNLGESKVSIPDVNISSSVPPRQRLKPTHSKLSSCVAALVALQAKKVACIPKDDQASLTKEPSGSFKDGIKGSPKMPKSPKSSPSMAAGSPPAIPKVRIKTIKTSSGEIKRTVTRILPESDDLGKSSEESPAESLATEEFIKCFPSPDTSAVIENEANKTSTKNGAAVTIQVSNVASPLVDGMKVDIAANSASTASLSPVSNCSSGAIKIGAVSQQPGKRQQQQQGIAIQPSNSTTSSLLPKAIHLANLNLVPHSVAASVAAKSSVQRRNQPQLTQMTVPLVHQVKKAAPVIVEAFNKVLHSANPVPIYTPNLSPPSDSSIHLPTSGYCCLECGDSFALEKSLTQHYSRRSVHIEVMCTQCSTVLLFFNKCSLLKHARDHKSKGFIMQCSQLLMKPISIDQMFSPSPTSSSVCLAPQTLHLSSSSCKSSATLGSGTGTSTNVQPAMPLYTDPLRLIRQGLKCLECNKQAPDYVALAAHYQRTSEDNEGLVSNFFDILVMCLFCSLQRLCNPKTPWPALPTETKEGAFHCCTARPPLRLFEGMVCHITSLSNILKQPVVKQQAI